MMILLQNCHCRDRLSCLGSSKLARFVLFHDLDRRRQRVDSSRGVPNSNRCENVCYCCRYWAVDDACESHRNHRFARWIVPIHNRNYFLLLLHPFDCHVMLQRCWKRNPPNLRYHEHHRRWMLILLLWRTVVHCSIQRSRRPRIGLGRSLPMTIDLQNHMSLEVRFLGLSPQV